MRLEVDDYDKMKNQNHPTSFLDEMMVDLCECPLRPAWAKEELKIHSLDK